MSSADTFSKIQLSSDEMERYGRHLLMPEVGLAGQRKLKASGVLVVGVGGLGSPVAMYLAAAGVGRIGIVDFDVVEYSNLHRQILHTAREVGKSKLESAARRIHDVNPHVEIKPYETRLTSTNALEILADYDVIVDGSDNFPTRYLVNDACVLLGKPNVYGSVFRFEGQVSVLYAKNGPCYRCLYPEPPPPGLVPGCAESGVLGVLPGVIGTIQATEALKLLLSTGESLIGRLLLFDALTMKFRELAFHKDSDCPVCGDHPGITGLVDYEAFCGTGESNIGADGSFEISPADLKRLLGSRDDIVVVDVRSPLEYEIVNMGGLLIPLNDLPARVNELNLSGEIVIHCHHGPRGRQAVEILKQAGFTRVKNLSGGIDRWAAEIDTSMSRY